MATVTSLTATKIMQLAAGWEQIAEDQAQISTSLSVILDKANQNETQIAFLTTVSIPALLTRVAAAEITVQDLNETTIPSLVQKEEDNELAIENINTVKIPSVLASLAHNTEVALSQTRTFVLDHPPLTTSDRDLAEGDIWVDTSNGSAQNYWDGSSWILVAANVPDFSLTIRKNLSTYHLIY